MKGINDYPADWAQVAQRAKDRAGWRCERCGADHDRRTGRVLTVHHLNGDKADSAPWNLAAVCQRCHLSIQNRVVVAQGYMFEISPWVQRHLDVRDGRLAPEVLRYVEPEPTHPQEA